MSKLSVYAVVSFLGPKYNDYKFIPLGFVWLHTFNECVIIMFTLVDNSNVCNIMLQ